MAGEFSGADKTFQESVRREFPYSETHAIHFRPSIIDRNRALSLQGKVNRVYPRFALIEVEGYPNFVCNNSKIGGSQTKVGMDVKFEVEFSAKGPIVARPMLLQLPA
jgi:hypothetical protein